MEREPPKTLKHIPPDAVLNFIQQILTRNDPSPKIQPNSIQKLHQSKNASKRVTKIKSKKYMPHKRRNQKSQKRCPGWIEIWRRRKQNKSGRKRGLLHGGGGHCSFGVVGALLLPLSRFRCLMGVAHSVPLPLSPIARSRWLLPSTETYAAEMMMNHKSIDLGTDNKQIAHNNSKPDA